MKRFRTTTCCRSSISERTGSFDGSRSFFTLLFLLLLGVAAAHGQTSNELFSTSYTGAVPSGPTANLQTARLLLNTNNPTGNTIGATNVNVSVTASLSNQQYTGVNTGPGSPVVMFGGSNASGSASPASVPVFGTMDSVGGGTNGQFSNTTSGTAQGIDVALNNAFDLYSAVRQWGGGAAGAPATNSRTYLADLTLTFSSPVNNPYLHFVGMGGTSGSLGFSTELTLTTPGLTFTELQGSGDLSTTATQVNNGAVAIDASCSGTGADGACGTVRVNGTNITTITLQVYVRGDGGTATWGGTTNYIGDRWMLGVSLPQSYNVSGNVYQDPDGLGDGTVNGMGIGDPGGVQLYANLVDPSDDSVLGSVPVAGDGTYTLAGVPGGGLNYRIEISTNQGTALAAAPPRALPPFWGHMGENLGSGAGSDGLADGLLIAMLGTTNLANANFAINITTSAPAGITGRVVTPLGLPVSNAFVSITNASSTQVRTARTGGSGDFTFEGLPTGDFYIVTVTHKRLGTMTQGLQLMEYLSDVELVIGSRLR